MKIPVGEQLFRLFAGMAGGAAEGGARGAQGFIGAAVAEAGRGVAQCGEQGRDILDPFGDQVGGGAIALDAGGDAQQASGDHGLAEDFIDLRQTTTFAMPA